MQTYRNLSGRSGVVAFEAGRDYIRVQFQDGSIYRYTYASAGESNIEHMKRLATGGEGLNSFINKHVKYGYEKKER